MKENGDVGFRAMSIHFLAGTGTALNPTYVSTLLYLIAHNQLRFRGASNLFKTSGFECRGDAHVPATASQALPRQLRCLQVGRIAFDNPGALFDGVIDRAFDQEGHKPLAPIALIDVKTHDRPDRLVIDSFQMARFF